IYAYLKKKQIIHDLVEAGIFFLDNNGQLNDKWHSKYGDKHPLYSTVTGSFESSFVMFTVYSTEKIITKVCKDPEMY
ncbi:type I-C CRISPR-associated protein Cas8c/Csd1, partial [Heyndrickxia faecalis]